MNVNCNEYRKSMELVGLRLRLNRGIPDPKERREVEDRIRMLEKELGLR